MMVTIKEMIEINYFAGENSINATFILVKRMENVIFKKNLKMLKESFPLFACIYPNGLRNSEQGIVFRIHLL